MKEVNSNCGEEYRKKALLKDDDIGRRIILEYFSEIQNRIKWWDYISAVVNCLACE
jgi:hypothetical protein